PAHRAGDEPLPRRLRGEELVGDRAGVRHLAPREPGHAEHPEEERPPSDASHLARPHQNVTRSEIRKVAGPGRRSVALPIASSVAPALLGISASYHGISRYQSQMLLSASVSVAFETRSGNANPTGMVALTVRSLK